MPRPAGETKFVIATYVIHNLKGRRGNDTSQAITMAGDSFLPVSSLEIPPEMGGVFTAFDVISIIVFQSSAGVFPHLTGYLKNFVTIAVYNHFAIHRVARVSSLRQALNCNEFLVHDSPIPKRSPNARLSAKTLSTIVAQKSKHW